MRVGFEPLQAQLVQCSSQPEIQDFVHEDRSTRSQRAFKGTIERQLRKTLTWRHNQLGHLTDKSIRGVPRTRVVFELKVKNSE